jgi:hypothetical protein
LQFFYSFFDRIRIDEVLIILFSLYSHAIEVAQLAKTGDCTRRSGDATLSKEARGLFSSQDISSHVRLCLAICRDMTGIGIKPWIVSCIHSLIVTQLCIFAKVVRPTGRSRSARTLIGEEPHLLGPAKTHAKRANAVTGAHQLRE